MKNLLLQPDQYHYVGRYKTPLLYMYLCFPAVSRSKKRYYQLPPLNGGLYLDGHLFVSKKEWDHARDAATLAIRRRNVTFFRKYSMVAKRGMSRFEKQTKRLLFGPNTKRTIESFFASLHDYEYPWWLALPMDEGMVLGVTSIAKRSNGGYKEVEQSRVAGSTPLAMQYKELLQIRSTMNKKILLQLRRQSLSLGLSWIRRYEPQLARRITRHVARYRWFGMMHFWGSPFTEEKCLDHLLHIEGPQMRKLPQISSKRTWAQRRIEEIAYLRQMCADTCAYASYVVAQTFDAIAQRRAGISYNEAMWLTPPEFLSLMSGDLSIRRTQLLQRKRAYGLIQLGDKRIVLAGSPLRRLLKKFILPQRNRESLHGNIASRGIARGKVHVILSPDDVRHARRGDIIVASETTPDFMPAILQAAAIVTDQGGLTSHAAIVSRELGIPCIVGTKVATRVFNNRDTVEVNAEQGIVRKI